MKMVPVEVEHLKTYDGKVFAMMVKVDDDADYVDYSQLAGRQIVEVKWKVQNYLKAPRMVKASLLDEQCHHCWWQ